MPWHLYIIRTRDGHHYTGISTDPQRRFREHCAQGPKTAKYLKAHPPEKLLFTQVVGTRSLALKMEHAFKRLSKADKERCIRDGQIDFDEDAKTIRSPVNQSKGGS